MLDPSQRVWRRRDVAITGVAAASSLGVDAEANWRNMLAGRCGMAPMPAVESTLPPGSLGGQAADLPGEYRPDLPREARYLRWTVEHALRDARVEPGNPYTRSRRCAVLGTTLHGMRAGGRFVRSGNPMDLGPFLASATSRLALEGLGVEGGAITTCSACSSSLSAIALGVTLLERAEADLVIAGGYDTISEYAWAGFHALRLIAPGPLRPFCRGRQGMKVAEGYGIVVLERAESAASRHAAPRAWLAGWGESADAHHLTQPHPQGDGALAAMHLALRRACVKPAELGMVAAHATGTPDNDRAEFLALSRLLGEDLPGVPVVGFKSFLGHTLGAAGAVELVMSCLALRDQRAPACPNVRDEDIEFPGLSVAVGKPETREIASVLNTSLGFGGANACVVLTKPSPDRCPDAGNAPGEPGASAWITGVGVLLPGAVGHAAFVGRATSRRPDRAPDGAATLNDDAIGEYLNVRRARRLSQYVKLTLAAATMAVRDAALGEVPDGLAAGGAILGSMHGSAGLCFEYYSQIVAEGALAANPVLFAEGVPNAAAAHLGVALGLRGGCQTIIGSRAAGLDALALAALRICSGAIELMVVVAAEAPCEVVDRAYTAAGLQARTPAGVPGRIPRGFTATAGGVALVIESSRSATARGASPYARVLGSARASAVAPPSGGPVGAVASVLSRLSEPGRVIGSACNTWVDRAERLGMRRAGVHGESGTVHNRFGEAFSVSPMAAIAAELIGGPGGPRFSILCTDWSGAASGVTLERLERRLGAPAGAVSEVQS